MRQLDKEGENESYKKNYTAGQTVITADNLNEIQEAILNLEEITKNSNNKFYYGNQNSYIPAQGIEFSFPEAKITIPANTEDHQVNYLILVQVEANVADNSSMVLANYRGTNITTIVGKSCRGTAMNGGGVAAWFISRIDSPTQETVIQASSYSYLSAGSSYQGRIVAIRLN